jgi:hypothetical protein
MNNPSQVVPVAADVRPGLCAFEHVPHLFSSHRWGLIVDCGDYFVAR